MGDFAAELFEQAVSRTLEEAQRLRDREPDYYQITLSITRHAPGTHRRLYGSSVHGTTGEREEIGPDRLSLLLGLLLLRVLRCNQIGPLVVHKANHMS